jgi:calcineurin-like phosphoesterase family protein
MKNNVFFTADEHYGHANVIKYCNRPFASVGEMDTVLRDKMHGVFDFASIINQATLYHVGDYSFDKSREPGPAFVRHIYLKGNHDTPSKCDAFSLVVQHHGVHINVVHWPEFADNKYAINIVGHVHNLWKYKMQAGSFLVNVGVDEWGFAPVSIEEIFQLWKRVKQGREKQDGHEV